MLVLVLVRVGEPCAQECTHPKLGVLQVAIGSSREKGYLAVRSVASFSTSFRPG